MRHNSSLQVLNLCHTRLTEQAILKLGRGLRHALCLKSLLLSGNLGTKLTVINKLSLQLNG